MNKFLDYVHHLFIPREDNNYRSKALHINYLAVYLLIALSCTVIFKQITHGAPSVLGFATDITVEKLFQLTNEQRTKNKLNALTYNDTLAVAAQKKAADMFAKNYWAHYAPDGATPWDFIHSAGYKYEYAGENLAKNFLYSQGVVDAWMNSPSHRENILRSEYTDVGYAVVNGMLNGEQTTLVVQMFGKPIAAAAAIADQPITTKVEAAEAVPPVVTAAPAAPEPVVTSAPPAIATDMNRPMNNSLMKMFLNGNVLFLIFMIVALLLDLRYAAKMKIVRTGGKNIAHLMFFGFIFVGLVMILIKGSIL